jgi:hypothetical protein
LEHRSRYPLYRIFTLPKLFLAKLVDYKKTIKFPFIKFNLTFKIKIMKTKKRIHPIKKGLFVFALFFSFSLTHAQQWVDEKYQYDSIMDVPYGTAINFNGGLEVLRMDIYTPICDDINHVSRRPLMLWIHGGSFLGGDKNEMTQQCKQFAKKGYVTATINYRLGYVADDGLHGCVLFGPTFPCFFATDEAEWYRSAFRAIQDGKGALRYLINRNASYRIDTNNVFIAGESAGAFIALGIGLLDTIIEKPTQTYALANVNPPHVNAITECEYNEEQVFPLAISRPDLGSIDGSIEPLTTHYTIKGIGNFYGAMFKDLLQYHKSGVPKPAIFSYHQPCDLVVHIDSAKVYYGISACLSTLCPLINCTGIYQTPRVYGSRAFSHWNTNNGYGYNIHDEFNTVPFPGICFGAAASCQDQLEPPLGSGNSCHGFGYDNKQTRLLHMAQFFAPMVTTNPICDTLLFPVGLEPEEIFHYFMVYPNPTTESVFIDCENYQNCNISLYNVRGEVCSPTITLQTKKTEINMKELSAGVYLLYFRNSLGKVSVKKIIKK